LIRQIDRGEIRLVDFKVGEEFVVAPDFGMTRLSHEEYITIAASQPLEKN
jgi:hypothetical protein